MSQTFEQGWAARPFKEQFPFLTDRAAKRLDRLNKAITDMVMAGLITKSQRDSIRHKRFPKLVGEVVRAYQDRPAAATDGGLGMGGTITMTGEEYDAMAGELDRVSRELSCLQSVIAEPDELNAEPASDYETLRRQYLSLRLLTNSALARNRYLCRRDDRDMRAALSVNAANVSAERDTNAMLTDLLGRAEAERDALHAEAEALRVALLGIASVNPAERGIEWAKSYASDGLKGAGSELYARWLETFKEAEALLAENAALRESSQDVRSLVEALEECAASLAWNCLGECRAIHAGPIMPAAMALDTARTALAAHRQAQPQ